jgi:hypothetical protein
MSQSNIKQEVKDLITTLKEKGYAQKLNTKGEYDLLSPNDNPMKAPAKLPLYSTIGMVCRKHLNSDEYTDYVVASLPRVVGEDYHPLSGRYVKADSFLGTVSYNKYVPPQFKIQEVTEIQPFLDYMERMFPDSAERHVITQWLAHMLQYPAQRPSWGILVTSAQGTGKGYLFEKIIQPIIGQSQCSVVEQSYKKLFDKHSMALVGTQFCLVDDCSPDGMRKIYDKMKPLWTQETASVELKFENQTTIQVFTRMWINSNDVIPFPVPKEDRRLFAPSYINLPEDGVSTRVFLEDIDSYLECGGLQQIYSYLMSYSLEGFSHKEVPYRTDTLEEIINMGRSPIARDAEAFVLSKEVFSHSDVLEHVKDESEKPFLAALKDFTNSHRFTFKGKKESWWYAKSLSRDEARQKIQDKREPITPTKIEDVTTLVELDNITLTEQETDFPF